MIEEKYTSTELFGYTNGKSNYWLKHTKDGEYRSLITVEEYDNFESWEDKDFLWFDMLDRGIIFCIAKNDMDMFFEHYGKTKESKQFVSWLEESHWHIQFVGALGGFILSIPTEELDDFWNKIEDTVAFSTYEQYVTHTENSK